MEQEYSTMNNPVILFGNGEPPTHPSVLRYINEAKTYICLDGGVDTLITLGHKPDYVLGDLDSIKRSEDEYIQMIMDKYTIFSLIRFFFFLTIF